MFDKEKRGYVRVEDLQTIMKSLGRDPNEAIDIIQSQDFEFKREMEEGQDILDQEINFEDFLKIMTTLENRLVPGQEGQKQQQENEDGDVSPKEGSVNERNKYGCLLPRTGVHFLPDSKVVDFLKLLNDYRKKCCKEMNLTEAKRA